MIHAAGVTSAVGTSRHVQGRKQSQVQMVELGTTMQEAVSCRRPIDSISSSAPHLFMSGRQAHAGAC